MNTRSKEKLIQLIDICDAFLTFCRNVSLKELREEVNDMPDDQLDPRKFSFYLNFTPKHNC